MHDALVDFLRAREDGAGPVEVAREVLRLSGPDAVLEIVGRSALRSHPEIREVAPDLFKLVEDPVSPSRFALVGAATGAFTEPGSLLALGLVEVRPRGSRPLLSTWVLPRSPLPPERLRELGIPPERLEDALTLDQAAEKAAAIFPAGAELISFADSRPARQLLTAIRALGGREQAELPSPTLLAPVLRRHQRLRRGAGLAEAATAFGVPVPESREPGDYAMALAEVILRAEEEGLTLDLAPESSAPALTLAGTGISSEDILALPDRPGVYRFLDADGKVLYVGKGKNLRGRVRSYFRPGTNHRPGLIRIRDQVSRVEWEETGSDLTALLVENRRIRRDQPVANVQVGVHARRNLKASFVLFLPSAEPGRVELLFVREGRKIGSRSVSLGRPRIGPRMRELLHSALSGAPLPPADAESRILASWLLREGKDANRLDLGRIGGPEEAEALLLDYLKDPDLLVTRVHHL